MRVQIKRLEKGSEGVFGVLMINGAVCCLTLERPWVGNKRDVSCIPPDIYQCKRIDSPGFGETFEVANVPGRSNILFHAGNTINDSSGCILLGSEFGYLGDEKAVLESAKAVKHFMEKLDGIDFFPLQIINIM